VFSKQCFKLNPSITPFKYALEWDRGKRILEESLNTRLKVLKKFMSMKTMRIFDVFKTILQVKPIDNNIPLNISG